MGKKAEHNVKAYGKNFTSMTRGPFALKLRTCKIWQFIRFVIINIKMLIVVRKSH